MLTPMGVLAHQLCRACQVPLSKALIKSFADGASGVAVPPGVLSCWLCYTTLMLCLLRPS
jgi:hypothetical protein